MEERENNYILQTRLVEEAMKALGEDKAHKGPEIRGWIRDKYPNEFARLATSWSTYFTAITQDPNTRIERTPGRYTFFLRTGAVQVPPEASAPESGPPDDKESAKRSQREQLLYPPLAAWLGAQGFPAEVTATTKRGGIWGNPDVTGLKIVEGPFGRKDIEVSTVEAKLSSAYWKYYFFEAVAHKRFAQRAYFAFAVGMDEPSLADLPDKDEMREYGEKYGVGILVMFLPSADYSNLLNDATPSIDGDTILIQELWPAIFDPVTPSALSSFLRDVLAIGDDRRACAYGDPDGA